MIYFDDFIYRRQLDPREGFIRWINHTLIPAFKKVPNISWPFGKVFLQKLFDWQLVETLEALLAAPIYQELEKANIKNATIQTDLLFKAMQPYQSSLKFLQSIIDEYLNWGPNSNNFSISKSDIEAFVVENEEVKINPVWLENLKESCTHTPKTEDQKKFASCVKNFEEAFEELSILIKGTHHHVIDNNMVKGLFVVKNNKIVQTRHELLKIIK